MTGSKRRVATLIEQLWSCGTGIAKSSAACSFKEVWGWMCRAARASRKRRARALQVGRAEHVTTAVFCSVLQHTLRSTSRRWRPRSARLLCLWRDDTRSLAISAVACHGMRLCYCAMTDFGTKSIRSSTIAEKDNISRAWRYLQAGFTSTFRHSVLRSLLPYKSD